jgi:serum/glucocorticoid-regulated kinase 2
MTSQQNPYYFDADSVLRNRQTDTTVDTDSAIKGDLGPDILEYINEHVQEKLISHGLVRTHIPSPKAKAKCDFFLPRNCDQREKLLVIVQSKRNSAPGVWSRGLCISHGLNVGSMLPYVIEAQIKGFGVIILNPKKNSVLHETKAAVYSPDGSCLSEAEQEVLPIKGSETPEKHLSHVWDNYIANSKATTVCFLAFDEGHQLVASFLSRRRSSRIKCVALVEPQKSSAPVPSEVGAFLTQKSVIFERRTKREGSSSTDGTDDSMVYQVRTYGEDAIACELPRMRSSSSSNIALSVDATMESVLRLLKAACKDTAKEATNAFVKAEAHLFGNHTYSTKHPSTSRRRSTLFPLTLRWVRSSSTEKPCVIRAEASSTSSAPAGNGSVTVNDFKLLLVVGKGAFGKVFLVQRKSQRDDSVLAMKVLQKQHVYSKNQVEHTAAERRILADIDHPFLVKLRYAFQTSQKLYLVMDYYVGGALYYHLRKSGRFSVARSRFYAAELFLAISHLHSQNIVYRDLKLENVLMDKQGHVYLTDFGLSKEGVTDDNDGAETFCGTAEYVAPELLHHNPYGKAADWWSFGILVYEMLTGGTPFFSRNRAEMFSDIIETPVCFPLWIDGNAIDLIDKLLQKDPLERIGLHGTDEVTSHPFFRSIDWEQLLKKELKPPYKPKSGLLENVPRTMQRQTITSKSPTADFLPGDARYEVDHHFEDFNFFGG